MYYYLGKSVFIPFAIWQYHGFTARK